MWPSHEGRRVLIQHLSQWNIDLKGEYWWSTSKGRSKIFSKSSKIVQSNSTTFVWDVTVRATHFTILVYTISHSFLAVCMSRTRRVWRKCVCWYLSDTDDFLNKKHPLWPLGVKCLLTSWNCVQPRRWSNKLNCVADFCKHITPFGSGCMHQP